eukprot:1158751-Pelagomonas_calceolata.AAC.4
MTAPFYLPICLQKPLSASQAEPVFFLATRHQLARQLSGLHGWVLAGALGPPLWATVQIPGENHVSPTISIILGSQQRGPAAAPAPPPTPARPGQHEAGISTMHAPCRRKPPPAAQPAAPNAVDAGSGVVGEEEGEGEGRAGAKRQRRSRARLLRVHKPSS